MIVHMSHSTMTASWMPEVTWSKSLDHYCSDAQCDRNGSMPDLRESHTRKQFTSANSVAIQAVFGSPFDSGHPCDSHVRITYPIFQLVLNECLVLLVAAIVLASPSSGLAV